MIAGEGRAYDRIRHTINAYAVAGDSRDAALFLTLFAEGAVFELAGFPPVPGFRRVGLGEIAAGTSAWSPRLGQDPLAAKLAGEDPSLSQTSFVRHHLTTCLINLEHADSASARTYFMVLTDIGLDHCGSYSDKLERHGTRWLFRERKVSITWRSPNALYPAFPVEVDDRN